MNRFVCHVQLCDGNWGRQILEGTVADVVESCELDCDPVRLGFLDPDGDDVLLAFEADIRDVLVPFGNRARHSD